MILPGNTNLSMALPDLQSPVDAASDHWHESPKSEVPELDTRVFLSFDCENEGPYERAVERLINEGKLKDALALSDRFLRNGGYGASDRLLQLLIEHGEASNSVAGQAQGFAVCE